MTAIQTINLALFSGFVLAVAYYTVARQMLRRGSFGLLALLVAPAAGLVGCLILVLPVTMSIARADLSRAPTGFLVAGLLAGLVAAAILLLDRPRVPWWTCLGVAVLATMPSAPLTVAGGAVGAANRNLRACRGNLKAVAKALRGYVHDHDRWPGASRWVDNLMPYVPVPSVYRCPASSGEAYRYIPPADDAPPQTPVIVCKHPFLGFEVVVTKSFKVELRTLRR